MIGNRIRQARLSAGLYLRDVVTQLEGLGESFSKQRLSNYERNKRNPSAAALTVLGRALGVRPAYFLEEPDVTIRWMSYRCQSRLGKRQKEEIEAFGQSVAERHMYLQATLFPNEKPALPNRQEVATANEAEAVAVRLRDCWQLGRAPIDGLTQTIEKNGGIVVDYEAEGVRFDGLSGWVNDQFPLLVVNSHVPDDRRRFDLAHELGHLLMECGSATPREEENLAYRFAGALLVPAEAAFQEVGVQRRTISLQELVPLKANWGLSMQAWLRRLHDLGIINDPVYKTACIEFGKRGWRQKEPVRFEGHEQRTRLRQMTLRALAEGVITQDKAQQLCPEATEAMEMEEVAQAPTFALASELMRLPAAKRRQVLAKAAALVEKDYRTDPELTDFEAFGEEDLLE